MYIYYIYIERQLCVCTCDESIAEGLVAEGLGQQRRVEPTLVVLAHLHTDTGVRGTAVLGPSVVMEWDHGRGEGAEAYHPCLEGREEQGRGNAGEETAEL